MQHKFYVVLLIQKNVDILLEDKENISTTRFFISNQIAKGLTLKMA